jgi:PTS system fructose-specific IIC component
MAIYELLDEKSIKIGLDSKTKTEVMEELVDLLLSAGKIQDKYKVLEAVEERERKDSTGIGHGIAVPHCKTDAVRTLTAGLGVSKGGIDFDSFDNEPARIFFILLAEPNNPGPHVRALAKLARLLQSADMRNEILSSSTPAECLELIRQKELED